MIDKEKPMQLKQAIKNRNTQKFNANFFKDSKLNVNFIPLPVNCNDEYSIMNKNNYYKLNSSSYSNTNNENNNNKGFSKNNSSYNHSNN